MRVTPDPTDDARAARLLGRYAHAIDAADVAGVTACLTDDGTLEYEGGAIQLTGRDAIRDFLAAKLVGASTHLISNVIAEATAEGPVARAAAIVCVTREAGTVLVRGVQYEVLCDDTARDWRIARLRHRAIWQFAAPNDIPPA